ncbi:MAG: CidA/LrgA family protein [Solobacterium sp.]|nr:CidA/LrgA family protein [Solobacterium sp.]
MRHLKQFGIILLVTCIGEIIRFLVPLPIPGSIYGLVLMLILLCTHVVKLQSVWTTASFLIEIMSVMFIPAAVGLIQYWGDLQPILLQTVLMIVLSTVIVMAVTGITAQKIIEHDRGGSK